MKDPLAAWKGKFGIQYTHRNELADWKIERCAEAFRRMIGHLDLQSILEVGSNIGLNLIALNLVFGGKVNLYAIEPNEAAFQRLRSNSVLRLSGSWNGDAFNISLPDGGVDLAFTSGVLIHIAPDRLAEAAAEIVRVSRKYILCIEYFSHTPVEVPYREKMGLLFKRDFGGFYLDCHPNLKPIAYGFLWQREFPNFDNPNWWLFEK